MSIDTSGRWWCGSEPEDIGAYLRALTEEGYEASLFQLSRCACGSIRFHLSVEQEEGVAIRECEACGDKHFICDSKDHWRSVQRLQKFKCPTCKSKVANVGVGYAPREDGKSVRWLYVGNRCAECGVLGSMVSWKVEYEPSLHLLGEA